MIRRLIAAFVAVCFAQPGTQAAMAQSASKAVPQESLNRLTHSSTMRFVSRSGSCVFGTIKAADTHAITVEQSGPDRPSIVLPTATLLQISQGDAPVFSTRSSWSD